MAFDDGAPLDAAALQALDTKLNEIRSSIPKIGTSVVNVNNALTQNITQASSEIIAGLSNFKELIAGKSIKFPISWGQTLKAKPVAVIVTPAKSNGQDPTGAIGYAVDTTSVGTDGCDVDVYLEAGAKPYSIKFYWMVIATS